ncbi:MAG: CBS domain-containing protein [Chloroflexi bacterium]|nr:CBS domain-containing protein [Chloroflexota bacterium]
MATVKQLIDKKGDGTNYVVACTDQVINALKIMAEANVSAIMVTEDDKVVGIFTERDYSRKGELQGLSAKNTPVQNLMTEQMMTVTPETSIDQCMELMKQYRIRHLPVVEKNTMIGMVSMRDVVDTLLADRESEIIGMQNYFLGTDFAT